MHLAAVTGGEVAEMVEGFDRQVESASRGGGKGGRHGEKAGIGGCYLDRAAGARQASRGESVRTHCVHAPDEDPKTAAVENAGDGRSTLRIGWGRGNRYDGGPVELKRVAERVDGLRREQ